MGDLFTGDAGRFSVETVPVPAIWRRAFPSTKERRCEVKEVRSSLAPNKSQQIGVNLILMRGCETMRCAGIIDLLRAFD